MEPIILASGSPRRCELLKMAGIPFEVFPADVDETCDLPAPETVVELSRRKARASAQSHPGRWILAADTLVSIRGETLGKPHGEDDAVRMLRRLRANVHHVYTGVTVISPAGDELTGSECTDVTFEAMTEREIRAYVSTGEPMDKAGAYAIQGRAAMWITGIRGCYTSVIGLPLPLTRRLLEQAGYSVFAWTEAKETGK